MEGEGEGEQRAGDAAERIVPKGRALFGEESARLVTLCQADDSNWCSQHEQHCYSEPFA